MIRFEHKKSLHSDFKTAMENAGNAEPTAYSPFETNLVDVPFPEVGNPRSPPTKLASWIAHRDTLHHLFAPCVD